MRTFDQDGNLLREIPRDARLRGGNPAQMAGLGESFGASVYDLFHPGDVQMIDRVTGQPERTTAQVIVDSFGQTVDAAATGIQQGIKSATEIGTSAAQWLIVGLVAYAVISVMGKVPNAGAYRTRARRAIKRVRRRAARYVRG